MPNTELLNRTLRHIEAHPEQWNQGAYAVRDECGTMYCFAGWAVALERPDAVPDFDPDDDATAFVIVDGKLRSIDLYAQELLGLTGDQASELFFGMNSLEDLRHLVGEFTASEPPLDAESPAGA